MTGTKRIGTTATAVRLNYYGSTSVKYHDTEVVCFNEFHVWLDSGGWLTATTKRRMNQVSDQYDLGYKVYQKNKVWYVDLPDGHQTREFSDNMVFSRKVI